MRSILVCNTKKKTPKKPVKDYFGVLNIDCILYIWITGVLKDWQEALSNLLTPIISNFNLLEISANLLVALSKLSLVVSPFDQGIEDEQNKCLVCNLKY